MPNNATAKTKSVRKHRWLTAGALAAAAVLLVGIAWWLLQPVDYSLSAGNKRYRVEVANDEQERKRGLSGRQALAGDEGMLFVFSRPGFHCIWMKDMRFALDIVWLDAQKRVIQILEQVGPDTYPESFCPARPASYVVELNAGQVQAAGIKPGQVVQF